MAKIDYQSLKGEGIFTSKDETFQVTVRILEGRQLFGVDIDPAVLVKVANQDKHTKKKKSTCDPTFDDHFIFDFKEPPAVLFDQMLVLEAYHTTRVLRRHIEIGSFKIDLRTVYSQPNHMFFHRYAVLLDPHDPLAGPKGYIKCDIMVAKKGEPLKIPPSFEESDDIEAQLLLPEEMTETVMEQQPARYILSIHKAEDLPGIKKGAAKKGLLRGKAGFTENLDSYVHVSFAGQWGNTRVKKDTNSPEWSQQIMFTELFPPLVRNMRIHVKQADGTVLGTTFLDMGVISDNTIDGYMPTFGPSYVNLYGGPRHEKNGLSPLNFGLGEGYAYRGRLLLSLKVEIEESLSKKGLKNVSVKNCLPLPENACGPKQQFMLFSTIMEANMIDKSLANKPISFELSIGNYGCDLDGFKPLDYSEEPGGKGKEKDKEKSISRAASRTSLLEENTKSEKKDFLPEPLSWHSRTPPIKPTTKGEGYYYMVPYGSRKPCLYVFSEWEDQRNRLFNVNMMKTILTKFENALMDIVSLIEMEHFQMASQSLRSALDVLGASCNEYLSYLSSGPTGSSLYETILDKERFKQRARELQKLCLDIVRMKGKILKGTVISKLKESFGFLDKLRLLGTEAQESLPDVFLWLVSGERRVAYQRFKAEDLIYSVSAEENGMYCGKTSTFFLKVPGAAKKAEETWEIWGRVTAYFWFGLTSERFNFLSGLRKTYQLNIINRNPSSPDYIPPTWINYKDSSVYELRCHIYQGRSLTAADESGLSDPFVRVLFGGESVKTQVCYQTVNPLWDQCLVIPIVKIFGESYEIASEPPKVVIQVFDQDDHGVNELLGQAEASPLVKMMEEKYQAPKFPPTLNWIPLNKGKHRVGEVLGAFELFELGPKLSNYPKLPFEEDDSDLVAFPVPDDIRPQLLPFRLDVLFWGLRGLGEGAVKTVEKPKIEIEIGGCVLSSPVLPSYKKSQNFPDMIKTMEVMLPKDPLYRPPVTIRCVDCKTFGRSILVGSHIIGSIDAYIWDPPKDIDQNTETVEMKVEDYEIKWKELKNAIEGTDNHYLDVESGRFSSCSSDSHPDSDGPPPPSAADLQAFNRIYESDNSEVDPEETQGGFFKSITNPDGESDAKSLADSMAAPSEKSVGSKSPDQASMSSKQPSEKSFKSSRSQSLASMSSGVSKRSERSKASTVSKMSKFSKKSGVSITSGVETEESDEYEVEEKEESDEELGSLRPLPAMPKKDSETQRPHDGAKKAPKQPAETLDWWSKFYVSVQEKEEEKRKQMKPIKKRKRKRRKGKTNKFFKAYHKTMNLVEKVKTKSREKIEEKKEEKPAEEVGEVDAAALQIKDKICRIKLFESELENVEEFNGFRDLVQPFKLFRGKKSFSEFDESNRLVGTFKGNLNICQLPVPYSVLKTGFFPHLPSAEPQPVVVRVYIIRASDLRPMDASGKADPYVCVSLGRQSQKDKKSRVHNQLNPVFGKVYEFEGTFPPDTKLNVQIWDWDRVSADDLIGETVIDLEQRYLSRHRGRCGLSLKYEKSGYNAWRDSKKPSQILSNLCRQYELKGPYYKPGQVIISGHVFELPPDADGDYPDSETVALHTLHHWEELPAIGFSLLPEHVERRTLYNPMEPGASQGSVDMWVDIFPKGGSALSPPLDITPRAAKAYELRVIVWDTQDVIMTDLNILTGSRSVDQYVKAYLIGPDIDGQQTDVHYRSNNGEGMFNWRFIYKFDYLDAEAKIVSRKKSSVFALTETEEKIAPRLQMQVWDADTFSSDDYLGTLVLDLHKLPRGARTAKLCNENVMEPTRSTDFADLFVAKRTRGWWPFLQTDEDGFPKVVGKVDLEFQLMTFEDAEKKPAGLGREEPDPMPAPARPETSFAMFANPLKFLKMVLWDQLKWKLLWLLIIILLILFVAFFVYELPAAAAQKMVG